MAAVTGVMSLPLPMVSVAGIGFTVASKLAFRAGAANVQHVASMGVINAPRPRLGSWPYADPKWVRPHRDKLSSSRPEIWYNGEQVLLKIFMCRDLMVNHTV
jgi:hypothetical protein